MVLKTMTIGEENIAIAPKLTELQNTPLTNSLNYYRHYCSYLLNKNISNKNKQENDTNPNETMLPSHGHSNGIMNMEPSQVVPASHRSEREPPSGEVSCQSTPSDVQLTIPSAGSSKTDYTLNPLNSQQYAFFFYSGVQVLGLKDL